ncbi:hypothetical protein J4E85_008121 [Alternaria conjuncta]|uniref:uncharacterized protein n=1 Tax=Alternaria conjuncta TaxID=181017 RepID=UPI00221FB767|nr:uncharacterized protein J4E85_008121 [Alternaria conjuncta]KAI4923963.1 hypothetical protein J4E85_008121 [Alternaria conjuncta]
MTPPRTATAPHIETGTKPAPAKNPRGRPRKDGLPAGSVPKKPKTPKRARADTPTETQGQPEKRGPGRPPKNNKSQGAKIPSATLSSSNPYPPTNPIPSRGPQEESLIVSATEETSNIQITVTAPSDVTVRRSEETDISEQRIQDTLSLREEAERNEEIGAAASQYEKQREVDALEFEFGLFEHNHEQDLEPSRKRVAFADEEDEEAEQAIGTEESKRKAERRRQRRECRNYGCYEEDCRIGHAVRANVARYMLNLDERTEALRPLVVKTDDEVMEEGTRPMIFDYPWLIAR